LDARRGGGLSSVFEQFDLEKMESGQWLMRRRDSTDG